MVPVFIIGVSIIGTGTKMEDLEFVHEVIPILRILGISVGLQRIVATL
jgi:hypothetical protein